MVTIANKINLIQSQNKSNVIFSADLENVEDIIDITKSIKNKLLGVKIHSDFYNKTDLQTLIEYLTNENLLIIDDRKFSDIGYTVKKQSYNITKFADLITVHAIPGESILEGLETNCLNHNCGILLIAEMSTNSLINETYVYNVITLAKKYNHIVTGFICQQFLDADFLHFTPGVNITDNFDDFGQNYNSPQYIIDNKNSDILIVGRGIYTHKSPSLIIDDYIHLPTQNKKIDLDAKIIRRICDNNMIAFGNYKLKSGKKSYIYIDMRRLISIPDLFKIIATKMAYKIINKFGNVSDMVIVGVPNGAIPLATLIASILDISLIMVRNEQKNHGEKKLIEGIIDENIKKDCIVIEDTITTGTSVINTINKLKNSVNILYILTLFARDFSGINYIRDMGLEIDYLYDINKLMDVIKQLY